MKKYLIIRELNLSLARMTRIISSDFHNSRNPDYITQLRQERKHLQTTIKSIQTNATYQLRRENKVWADYFFAWATAMHTIYGYESTKDSSFYTHCDKLRSKRDNALEMLGAKS